MSNKLVKHQEQKERLTGKQKRVLFWCCFAILCLLFMIVWIHIFMTSAAFHKKMEKMVEGQDYYIENIRFLYNGIIIKHQKTEPTYTKTSLFLCEKRRFFMARREKGVVPIIYFEKERGKSF